MKYTSTLALFVGAALAQDNAGCACKKDQFKILGPHY